MPRALIRSALRAFPLFIGAAILSCGEAPTEPRAGDTGGIAHAGPSANVVLPSVRVSEFHYDNTGGDVGEKVEISFPTGMSLTGWQLVLYNGSGGAAYTTTNLTTGVVTVCGARSVVVISYGADGIQNGSPDGMVVSGPGPVVSDSLSYEGSFTAVGGVAGSKLLPDIGVSETSTTPIGFSLQRDGSGAWSAPKANTFGACNDDGPTVGPPATVTIAPDSTDVFIGSPQQFTAEARDASNNVVGTTFAWTSSDNAIATVNPNGQATGVADGVVTISATSANGVVGAARLRVKPAPPPSATNVHIVEIHYDNDGTDTGEQVELIGTAGGSLTGWSLALYNFTDGKVYQTIPLSGVFPSSCGSNGVIVVPAPGLQNGPSDGIALVNSAATVVEFLSYEGVLTATNGPANGQTSVDIGVTESNTSSAAKSLLRAGDGTWYGPATSSFGICNPDTRPVFPNYVTFSGRNSSDPALPVAFEDQLFAALHDGLSGDTITSTFTWSSDTPAIATIDAFGVMHALAAGTATFRATASDGTTGTWTLPMAVAVASATALYGNNTEFGDPVDADQSDDFIIRRPQFTTSYSRIRNTPNWVAYNLEATHIGTLDRCDCFTHDPLLPGTYAHVSTADYTGSAAFAGYRIDRGHLARSFDRTTGTLDNAYTFLLSNIIPQSSELNQGSWAQLENALGDSARFGGREVYIIAGVAGNKGTLRNEGKVVIPTSVWKVAVIMSRDQGLADVHSYQDITVLAVIAPNEASAGSMPWTSLLTTVDAVEALSGYDLLSLLPDKIERAVESNTKPPVALVNGPYTGAEGSSIAMSGAASVDYNGTLVGYDWSFGDGGVATGASATHIYAQDGSFTVRLIVTDNDGLADTTTTTAQVTNVAPAIDAIAGATLFPGETFGTSSSFTDPGADAWSATVDYGDGSGALNLSLSGQTFILAHRYAAAGTFTVTVRVSDDDVTSSRTQIVTVLTPLAGLDSATAQVSRLIASGAVSAGNGNSLKSKIDAAAKSLTKGNITPALNQLDAFLNEVDAMEASGRLTSTDAGALRTLVNRIRASITA